MVTTPQEPFFLKRKRIVFWILLGSVIVVCAIFLFPREPQFEGKPLSAWLEQYSGEIERPRVDYVYTDAARSIHKIGAPAVPYLLNAISVRDSAAYKMQQTINSRQTFVSIDWTDQRVKVSGAAAYAFLALGDEGKSAFPTLTNLFLNPEYSVSSSFLPAIALAGTMDGITVLLSGLTHTNHQKRWMAAFALGEADRFGRRVFNSPIPPDRHEGGMAASAVRDVDQFGNRVSSALLKVVGDSEPSVRITAARALGCFRFFSGDVISTLCQGLSDEDADFRRTCAHSLSRIPAPTKEIIAALTIASLDEDPEVRHAAAWAIEIVQPGNHEIQPIPMDSFREPL